MNRYDPKTIEPKWQQTWDETSLYKTDTSKAQNKHYIIPMFPYTSGDLHVGHWYCFAPTDTLARWRRMLGHNVLHCTGFDAFGLPAENAAIKRNIPPATWTYGNIENMTRQLKTIGPSYDWSRQVTTCDPDYYRWTQWLFVKLYEQGLAYREKGLQNWCPSCQTVLANEQVVGDDNHCERCGTPVVKKELEQWFFKITDYADRLLDDAAGLDWPERVKTMQTNWIGRSKGAHVDFKIDHHPKMTLQVFTTRPDTLFGATYMVLAPEHPLVEKIVMPKQTGVVRSYVEQAQIKTELDRKEGGKQKTGVFTGVYAINPVNDEKIPVWIADYVLMSYGTGAIMAVPGHDQRDYEFAQKFDIPIRFVVEPTYGKPQGDDIHKESVYVIVRNPQKDKAIVLDWGPRKERHGGNMLIGGGLENDEDYKQAALREITEETGYQNLKFVRESDFLGHGYFYSNTKNKNMHVSGKGILVDLIDETRTDKNLDAGEHDKFKVTWQPIEKVATMLDDGIHEAMYRYLMLGEVYSSEGVMVNSGQYDGMSSSEAREKIVADLAKQKVATEQTNYKLRDWLISRQRYWGAPIPIIYCETCGTVPVPEKDLPVILPEEVDFEPTGQSPLLKIDAFVRTKCPSCGKEARRETDTMDTFVDSSWYFLRYPDPTYEKSAFNATIVNKWAPVDHYIGGIEHAILHLLYARFITKFLHDHQGLTFDEPFKRLFSLGLILGPDGNKMSKSKGNVVNPDDQVAAYGADTLRLYLMFMGPYEQGGPFSPGGMAGTRRFIERVWSLVQDYVDSEGSDDCQDATALVKIIQKAARKVTADLENLSFNTAIATLMEMVNSFYKLRKDIPFENSTEDWKYAIERLLQLLAPFAPHVSEELWYQLGNKTSIHLSSWPTWDEDLIRDELITIVVQVNGKVRDQLLLSPDSDESAITAEAQALPKVSEYLKDQTIKKTIYVPNKLINFVV